MEKYSNYLILGICLISAMLGIALGYLVFGPIQASAMANRETAFEYVEQAEFTVSATEETNYIATNITEATEMAEITEPLHKYLVTALDGFIVVYNMAMEDKLGDTGREVTTTSINALDQKEQNRLLDGIRIYSEEALVRILEDYGS